MKVGYSIGKTVNLGNYESLRVDVKFEWDTNDDSTTYDEMKQWAEDEVKARVLAAQEKGHRA